MIYRVIKKQDWQKALAAGSYEDPSLQSEGFIHTSDLAQVPGVLNRFFKNEKDLLLLHIDESKLTAPLKYEMALSLNEMFPHIFGPINLDAIIKTEAI